MDERWEHFEDCRIALSSNLVHYEDEPGVSSAYSCGCLDEFSCRQREAQHDHYVQSIQGDAVRQHGRRSYKMNSVRECFFGAFDTLDDGSDVIQGSSPVSVSELRSSSGIWASNDRAAASTSLRVEPYTTPIP